MKTQTCQYCNSSNAINGETKIVKVEINGELISGYFCKACKKGNKLNNENKSSN